MFLHNFKYSLKVVLRTKESIFWCMIFPIALATFMYLAFGKLYDQEKFDASKAALVGEGDAYIETLMTELSKGDDPLLEASNHTEEEALALLENKEIDAIVYLHDASMKVAENTPNATVVESVLLSYKEYSHIIEDMIKNGNANPVDIENIVNEISNSSISIKSTNISRDNMNPYNSYFFAIFAMSALFASFTGVGITNNLQANMSNTGIRRSISKTSKGLMIIAEFCSIVLIHFVMEIIALLYMLFVLKLDFGNQVAKIIPCLLVATMFGISLGVIVGSSKNLSFGSKIGACTGISMSLSVMADLCVAGLKYQIELHAPVINDINPAALITDCFQSLYVYQDNHVYMENLYILLIETAIFLVIAFLKIRRTSYASI